MDDKKLAFLLEKYGFVELDIEDDRTDKRLTIVSIKIAKEYNELLDRIACRYGTPKSELIRRALDKYIFSQKDLNEEEIEEGSKILADGELVSISFKIEEKKIDSLLYKGYFNGLTISDLIRYSIFRMLSEME